MTITEIFESMPQRFNAEAAAGINKTIQWNITGTDEGVWAFQILDGVGNLIPGGVEKADATFTVSGKDWLAIAENRLDATRAFMTGKLKVHGDVMLAMKVQQFFTVEI